MFNHFARRPKSSGRLWIVNSILMGLAFSSTPTQAQKKLRRDTTNSADILPIHPRPCKFDQEMTVAVRVRGKVQYEAKPAYPVIVEKIHVNKGDRVKKGQLLISTNTSDQTQMLSIYNSYLSMYSGYYNVFSKALKVSENRRDRLMGLVKKGIVPQSDLEAAEKIVLGGRADLENVTRAKDAVRKNIAQLNEQIRMANFYSDIDGIVTDLIAEPRNMFGSLNVYPGTPVARVVKPGSYIADATLIDTQIHGMKAGMSATVIFGDGTSRPGNVAFVSPLSSTSGSVSNNDGAGSWGAPPDPSSKLPTYSAQIAFDRDGDILPNGLMASATLVSSKVSDGRCLPYNALNFEADKPFIRIFSEGSGWKRQPIEVGRRGRYEFEVKTKLDDEIVIQSQLW